MSAEDTEAEVERRKNISKMAADIEEMKRALQRVASVADYVPALQQTTQQLNLGMERLAILVETLPERCPHREAIARGSNNIKRVDNLEGKVESIEKSVTDEKLSRVKEMVKLLLIAMAGGGSTVAIEKVLEFFA